MNRQIEDIAADLAAALEGHIAALEDVQQRWKSMPNYAARDIHDTQSLAHKALARYNAALEEPGLISVEVER